MSGDACGVIGAVSGAAPACGRRFERLGAIGGGVGVRWRECASSHSRQRTPTLLYTLTGFR
jgi:hypothetical protein